jgi:UDP-N-acetylglucosamine transferase subunit ALG13
LIFVTVGSQLPFDRLIRAVDTWAANRGRSDVFAQIGASRLQPRHIKYVSALEPDEFRAALGAARIVVAHAGTGSVIAALELGKPILVMPRRARLGETRNDHQFGMAKRFEERGLVRVADDEDGLGHELDRMEPDAQHVTISPHADHELMARIRNFLHDRRA